MIVGDANQILVKEVMLHWRVKIDISFVFYISIFF